MRPDAANPLPGIALLRRLTLWTAWAPVILGLPALLGRYAPSWADLPGEFNIQYLLGTFMLALFGGFVLRMGREFFAICGLALAVNLVPVIPYLPLTAASPDAAAHPLKILQANVLFLNKETASLKTFIAAENPDIILVQEANSAFAKLFRSLKKDYPYQVVRAADHDAEGYATLSKLPLLRFKVITFPNAYMATQIFTVKSGPEEIAVFALHTANPLFGVAYRDAAFDGLAAWLKKEHPARIAMLGDFNATPWCPGLQRFMGGIPDLYNARQGRGLFQSWSAFLPLLFRIPIDELLLSSNMVVQDYRLGPAIGSDHFPMISTIALKEVK